MKKKIISRALSAVLLLSALPVLPASAENTEYVPQEEVLYYNTFDTGSNADLPEVTHSDFYYPGYNDSFRQAVNNYEYAAPGAPKNYFVPMAALSKAEYDGNVGVRLSKSMGVGNGPVVLFDFRYQDKDKTPTLTPQGIYSGKYALSFDFSTQGDVYDADGEVRILANCFHGNSANNLAHFGNKSWSILAGSNSWTYPSNEGYRNMELDPDAVYSYKMVVDFDNGKVLHYLNGELKGEIAYSTTIKFLMIVLNGDFDYFDNVKLTKELTYPVEWSVDSANTGNNFYNDEEMKFTVTATNHTKNELTENLTIKSTNTQGENETVLLTKQVTVPANGKASFDFSPSLNEYGVWVLSAKSDNSRELTLRAARSVSADEKNPNVGICFHMDGRHADCDIEKGFELMDNAGISIVRSDYSVGVTTQDSTNASGEAIKVPVSIDVEPSEWTANAIRESKEHGIDILPILYINKHSCYGDDEDGGYNTTEESLQLTYDMGKAFAERYKDDFKYFELGNEDNYRWKPARQDSKIISLSNKSPIVNNGYVYEEPGVWSQKYSADNYDITVTDGKVTIVKISTGTTIYDNVTAYEPESGADYAKVLKAGYDGVKAGNPDAVVMNSGSSVVYVDEGSNSIRNQHEFAEGLLGAAQADSENKYFDVFAVHSYHTGSAPEKADKWKRGMDFMEQQEVLTELLEDYGQISKNAETGKVEKNIERWGTEIGYSTAQSEERHYAAWLTRLMAVNFMGNDYGPYHDKFFIYALFNHGFDKAADAENSFGIVNKWADESMFKRTAYSVKEPYLAVAQWNKMMTGFEFADADIHRESAGKYDSNDDEILNAGLYNLKFTKNDEQVNVVWDASGNNEATTIKFEENRDITVYDMYGNVLRTENASSIDITSSEEPVYVASKGKAEVILYRDYEEYTGDYYIASYSNWTDLNAGTKKHGTLGLNTNGQFMMKNTAVQGVDGTGFSTNKGGNNTGSWKVDLAKTLNDGTVYVAFNIQAKTDEELTAQGDTEESVGDAVGYRNTVWLNDWEVNYFTPFSTMNPTYTWHCYNSTTVRSDKAHKVEMVVRLDDGQIDHYYDGEYVNTSGGPTELTKLGFRLYPGIKYFDNLAIVYYPSDLTATFSMSDGKINADDGSISVFLKSDTADEDEDITYTAPYGVSVTNLSASAFSLTDNSGKAVEIKEVKKGEKSGEYKIIPKEQLAGNMKYTVTAEGLTDILGAGINEKAASVTVEPLIPFEVEALNITADTEGKTVDWSAYLNSKVYAEVKYINQSSESEDFVLIGAVYSGERLVSLVTDKITASAGMDEAVTKYLEIPFDGVDNLVVKAFAVNSLENMKALYSEAQTTALKGTTLYYNDFPTGTAADLGKVEHEKYFFYGRNADLKKALNEDLEYNHTTAENKTCYTYSIALDAIQTSEWNGDKGVRVGSNCSLGAGPVVMLDFRYKDAQKTPTEEGALKTGVYKLSFDFVLDGEVSKSDGIRVEANCKHGNCGNSFALIQNGVWQNLSGGNTWTYTEKDIPITNDELHHYELIFNLTDDVAITFMDGVRQKDTKYTGNINFLHITMGGKIKYLDNIKLAQLSE